MPRSRLANVPLAALQAEIERRTKALGKLVAQRDALNRQIAELQAISEPQAPKPAAKRVKGKRKRGSFQETAEQMVLGLLAGGKSMATADSPPFCRLAHEAPQPAIEFTRLRPPRSTGSTWRVRRALWRTIRYSGDGAEA